MCIVVAVVVVVVFVVVCVGIFCASIIVNDISKLVQ